MIKRRSLILAVSFVALVGLCAQTLGPQVLNIVISSGKTITFSNTLTFSGTDGTSINVGAVANANLATMANSTVKCRTTAGTGAPEDCTAAQTAAIVGSVGGALKSKTVQFSRDLTAATGSVAYTGFGFQPTSCFATGQIAASTTQYTTIFSMADSARTAIAVFLNTTTSINSTAFLVASDATTTNFQIATIASYDADGFTLSWTKTAAPTGTFTFFVLCYR